MTTETLEVNRFVRMFSVVGTPALPTFEPINVVSRGHQYARLKGRLVDVTVERPIVSV
jgi:hypothetical protein